LQRGEPDKAVPALRKALKWEPRFVQAKAALGTAMFMKGKYDAAVELNTEVLREEPGFGPAWNNLALVHFERGEFGRAVECVDKALECGFEVRPEFLAEIAPHRPQQN
jgi:tetratricopeptide (TPR) repeat protein